jgi:hypothetical protein
MTDLTPTEQTHIRAALAFLHRRCGTWAATSALLHFKDTTLGNIACGHKLPTVTLALRIARVAKVGVDDVLTGKFPSPGTCPACGHQPNGQALT